MEWRFKSQVSLQHFTTTMTNYTSFWIFMSFNVVVFLMRMRREKVNEERYIENTLVTKCEPSILKACEICLECLQAFEMYLLHISPSFFHFIFLEYIQGTFTIRLSIIKDKLLRKVKMTCQLEIISFYRWLLLFWMCLWNSF